MTYSEAFFLRYLFFVAPAFVITIYSLYTVIVIFLRFRHRFKEPSIEFSTGADAQGNLGNLVLRVSLYALIPFLGLLPYFFVAFGASIWNWSPLPFVIVCYFITELVGIATAAIFFILDPTWLTIKWSVLKTRLEPSPSMPLERIKPEGLSNIPQIVPTPTLIRNQVWP